MMMKETIAIRVPKEVWGSFWKALLFSGEPVSCIEDGVTYLISRHQAKILKEKGINFKEVSIGSHSKI